MLLEVEAGAPCGRGRGSNDHLALAVEVASWNFTFSSCQRLGWEQVTSRARLEMKVSWKNNSVGRRLWLPFAQQPEGLRAWLELSLQLELLWQKLIM